MLCVPTLSELVESVAVPELSVPEPSEEEPS
jgi:hypothetical protein